jgi:hypothetical protein
MREVSWIELLISIHEHDQVTACRGEAGTQGSTVSAVGLMVNHPHTRIGSSESVSDLARTVPASIVDDDHLEVLDKSWQNLQRSPDDCFQIRCFVIRR